MTIKVGISQRVDFYSQHNEYRDCLDQRWTLISNYLEILLVPIGTQVKDIDAYFDDLSLSAVILSGGNDLACMPNSNTTCKDRDDLEFKIIRTCIKKKLPIIGVCRGLQVINSYFGGGDLMPVVNHANVRHNISILPNGIGLTPGKRIVNSYHNYGITKESLSSELELLATAGKNGKEIEAAYHKKHPILGMMWHPEREESFNKEDFSLILNI